MSVQSQQVLCIVVFVILLSLQQKRKMRLFVSHAFHNLPSAGTEAGADSQSVPEWELKIEGRPLDEVELLFAHGVCINNFAPVTLYTQFIVCGHCQCYCYTYTRTELG